MKATRLYILPIFLLAANVLVFHLSSEGRVESAVEKINAENRRSCEVYLEESRKLSDDDLAMAARLYRLHAKDAGFDFSVAGGEGKVTITAKDDGEALERFDSLLKYVSSLSEMPYSAQYETFCMGRGCGADLALTLVLQRP